jgi:hypothetical protein
METKREGQKSYSLYCPFNQYIRQPRIRVSGEGVSINKVIFPISILEFSKLGMLLGLAAQLPRVIAIPSNNYYQDLNETIYLLFLSGVADLSSAVNNLNAGECPGLSTTSTIPQEYVLIQNYYPHDSGTSSIYEAVLSRDKQGVTNQTIVDCISQQITEAHNAWQTQRTSPTEIIAIIGGFVAMLVITSLLLHFCNRKYQFYKKCKEPEKQESLSRPFL